MLYSDLKAALPQDSVSKVHEVKLNDTLTMEVRQYLSAQEKAQLVQYVVDMSMDDRTGCFSPIRVNVYFSIAMMKYYCGIDFGDENLVDAYDQLDSCGFLTDALNEIPQEERNYIESLINDTIEDISRYNSSFAGMIQTASSNADGLDASLKDILKNIKGAEGLELLSEIKNVVGND